MVIDSHNVFALEVKPTVQELRRGERLEFTHYSGGCFDAGREIKVICTQLYKHKTKIKIFYTNMNDRESMNEISRTILIYEKIVTDREFLKNLDDVLFAYRLPDGDQDNFSSTNSYSLKVEFYQHHKLKSSENYYRDSFSAERSDKVIPIQVNACA